MNNDNITVKALMFLLEDNSSSDSSDTDSSSSDSDLSIDELSVSESDDENEVEDYYLMPLNPLRRRDLPRTKEYVEKVVPLLTEAEFVGHFRLNRRTVENVGNMLMRDPQFTRLSCMTLWKQLLMTLWLIGSPESYRSVADRFDVSKSVLWLAVTHTCTAIARLSVDVIRWPSLAAMRASEQEFQAIAGFPGVVGCVDGTHIEISAPLDHGPNYVNRMDYHSIVLQGIANSRLQFIDCYVGEVGAVHDARVFANSDIGEHLADRIPPNFHLLGDAAYPLKVNLLTPYRDNGHLTRRQVTYNQKLSKTRSTIERVYGLLKGRFRRLKYLDIQCTRFVPTIVMACCVLHNLVITDKIHINQNANNDPGDNDSDDDDDDNEDNPIAAQKRREIMENL